MKIGPTKVKNFVLSRLFFMCFNLLFFSLKLLFTIHSKVGRGISGRSSSPFGCQTDRSHPGNFLKMTTTLLSSPPTYLASDWEAEAHCYAVRFTYAKETRDSTFAVYLSRRARGLDAQPHVHASQGNLEINSFVKVSQQNSSISYS